MLLACSRWRDSGVRSLLYGMAATNLKAHGKGPHICTEVGSDVFAVDSAFGSRHTVSSLQRSTKMKQDGAKSPRKVCKRRLGFCENWGEEHHVILAVDACTKTYIEFPGHR